ncbi:hypothetical protein BDL97_01G120400 [Sphagnum fallax]|nr:hypothetical protein BDL97_01G120400 [Sphagnum fallax]KAH8974804.1 hypothetical protein BDL97_01G120400 [Sphagnum fallax]
MMMMMVCCVRASVSRLPLSQIIVRRRYHVTLFSSPCRLSIRPFLGEQFHSRQAAAGRCCRSGTRWNETANMLQMRRVMVSATTTTLASNHHQSIFFSDAGIDRAAELRADTKRLSGIFNSPEALVVPLLGDKSLIKAGKPVLISVLELPAKEDGDQPTVMDAIFLGLSNFNQSPIFAIDVTHLCSTGGERPAWEQGAEWVDLRRHGPELMASEAGLLAYARGMVEWQSRNTYCGRCGARMKPKDGGHSLHCSFETCGNSAYPRLDPAVIMLVTCGNYVLLGRQGRWNPGRYSLLAGFLEIGETFEMAVVREVREESGINVDISSVSYAACQPWPFPSSLMVGFTAEAIKNRTEPYHGISGKGNPGISRSETLTVVDEANALPRTAADMKELEDARWVHRDLLAWVLKENPLPDGVAFGVPGKYAIAHVLMDRWTATKDDNSWEGNKVLTVQIDQGKFKYVLMSIRDNHHHEKLIVRGNSRFGFHLEILDAAHKEVYDLGLQVSQLGGGWIEHDAAKHKLHVFGASQAYGSADHIVTCALLRQWYPFHNITFSWAE